MCVHVLCTQIIHVCVYMFTYTHTGSVCVCVRVYIYYMRAHNYVFTQSCHVRGEVSLSRTVSPSTACPRMILSFRCLLIETVLIIIRVSSVTIH